MNILKVTEVNDIKIVLFTKNILLAKQKAYYATWLQKKNNMASLIDKIWLQKENNLTLRIDAVGERPAMTFNQAQNHFELLVKTAQNMTFENERKDNKKSDC